MFTPSEAIEAIKARQNGDYKNPQLLKLGPLSSTVMEDIDRIVANTEVEPKTKVLFLKDYSGLEILAVFPELVQTETQYPMIVCYSHFGQHSTTQIAFAKQLEQVTHSDYKPLLQELTKQGYNLEVLNGTGYKL